MANASLAPSLSRRLAWRTRPNPLSLAVERRRAAGLPILDLTLSNPTLAGIPYPAEELAAALARGAREPYRPDPAGLATAREALAAALATADDPVSPEDLLLTASTSEAYGFLFQVLADPGDAVLTPTPAYPLVDELAGAAAVRVARFPLDATAGFALDVAAAESACRRTRRPRALLVVHPSNPLGRFLSCGEQAEVSALCDRRGLALVSDEVFADYPLQAPAPAGSAPSAAALREGMAVALGGLSKSTGLPGWKLGWIRLGGAPRERRRLRRALERVADAYLSAATPVQAALPEILRLAPTIREAIAGRVRRNEAALRAAVTSEPAIELLLPQAGWSAVLRAAAVLSDEALALRLLERRGVLVQPGYLFDFPGEAYVALSLLPANETFDDGVRALVEEVSAVLAGSGAG